MARLHRGSGNHAVPEALDPIDEGAGARRVLARALADESRLEALQQLALLRGEVHRRLHPRLAIQVAGCADAHRLAALVPPAADLAGLVLSRSGQLDFPSNLRPPTGFTTRPLRISPRHHPIHFVPLAP